MGSKCNVPPSNTDETGGVSANFGILNANNAYLCGKLNSGVCVDGTTANDQEDCICIDPSDSTISHVAGDGSCSGGEFLLSNTVDFWNYKDVWCNDCSEEIEALTACAAEIKADLVTYFDEQTALLEAKIEEKGKRVCDKLLDVDEELGEISETVGETYYQTCFVKRAIECSDRGAGNCRSGRSGRSRRSRRR